MTDFDLSETVGELENMVNAAWDAGYAKGIDWAKRYVTGLDAMTDAELAEHGLVRMPVDADGVRIRRGDDIAHGGDATTVRELVLDGSGRMSAYVSGGWWGADVLAKSRHVKPESEQPDTPASLADELDALTVRGFEDDELHALADRLRAIGGAE